MIFLFCNTKKHLVAQNRVIWRIKRKNRSNGFARRRTEEPKKCSKFRTGWCIFHLYRKQKPLGGLSPNFFGGRRLRRNHAI